MVVLNPAFLQGRLVKHVGSYGHFGVEVFFVISGFVIPYSLYRGGYGWSDFPIFVCKRILRLDPPYLAAIALTFLIWFVASHAPGYQGAPFHFSLLQLLLHLGYINAFFGYPWILDVFWTLAIEFQYYLLMALLFPVLVGSTLWGSISTMFVMCALGLLLPLPNLVFHYWFLFLLGILTFYLRARILTARPYAILLVIAYVGTGMTVGWSAAGVGLATALTIAFVNISYPLFRVLGGISYSLYLIHIPVGQRVVNLGLRYTHSYYAELMLLVAAIATSLAAACLLYQLVEKPARRWSSRLNYASRGSKQN